MILKDVSQLKKHAVNTWLRYGGQMGLNVHDAAMIKPGIWNVVFTGARSAAIRPLLLQGPFSKGAGNR